MEKPVELYHGSMRKIKGDRLRPMRPIDITGRLWNSFVAVYATNIKEIAITFALIRSKGVLDSRLDFKVRGLPFGVIYEGWPKQEEIYLYTVPGKKFTQDPHISEQWYLRKSIRPSKIETLKTGDHISLIRKATDEEMLLLKEGRLN